MSDEREWTWMVDAMPALYQKVRWRLVEGHHAVAASLARDGRLHDGLGNSYGLDEVDGWMPLTKGDT